MFTVIRRTMASDSLCAALAAVMFPAGQGRPTAGRQQYRPRRQLGPVFPTEGESPVGNATVEDLAQYGAYYLGDTGEGHLPDLRLRL